eukprot:3728505-Rhodomonas_salina.1
MRMRITDIAITLRVAHSGHSQYDPRRGIADAPFSSTLGRAYHVQTLLVAPYATSVPHTA